MVHSGGGGMEHVERNEACSGTPRHDSLILPLTMSGDPRPAVTSLGAPVEAHVCLGVGFFLLSLSLRGGAMTQGGQRLNCGHHRKAGWVAWRPETLDNLDQARPPAYPLVHLSRTQLFFSSCSVRGLEVRSPP